MTTTTHRIYCQECSDGHLIATPYSFVASLGCDKECGHRVNLGDIESQLGMNESLAFDAEGYLTVVTED